MNAKPFNYRLLEIFPGALVWVTFILAIFLSFKAPLIVIVFIIIFDLFWLIRVIYFGVYLTVSWKQYKKTIKIDWLEAIRKLVRFSQIYHLIILPTYKEDLEVIRTSLAGLARSRYPKDKFIVVLAGEANDQDNFLRFAHEAEKEFGDKFFKFLVTLHPVGLSGEIIGKGSNVHHAGLEAKKLIDQLNIPYQDVITSVFDIDTLPHENYFAYLTHTYLNHPNPTRSAYQPIANFANNIWQSSSIVRIAAFGTTFWLMTELARPERLFTFSSHSLPFQALVDAGFHDPSVVSEDSRIFLQCLLRYDGDYTVTPLYLPVYMNTVQSAGYLQSLINLYSQQRRWAYGAENIPFMIWNFAHKGKIKFKTKFKYAFNLIEGMYSWATAPILIFILGRLPLYLAPRELKNFALVANTPFTLEFIMTAAMLGVFLSAVFSLFLLPPRPPKTKPYMILVMILQWILLPFTFVIFGSFPAIDAQTRLALGKYLGFKVTEKNKLLN